MAKNKKKSVKKRQSKKSVRSMTASTKDRIRALVEIVYSFLPMTYAPVTFETIFKESGIESYLNSREGNKKKKLQEGFTKLFRYHKKLPYTIIRKVVPAAIEYRFSKRIPLEEKEINQLISVLDQLDLDMRVELQSIPLRTDLPKIKVPSAQLIKRLENHPLTDEIISEPLLLFKNGHFNESVRKACERFEVKVQDLSGETEIGKTLMGKAFSLNDPLIQLNALSSENEEGIQEGYMHLTMGLMRAVRNIFSHGDADQIPPEECYEMLLFINWLFKQLPDASN